MQQRDQNIESFLDNVPENYVLEITLSGKTSALLANSVWAGSSEDMGGLVFHC